MISREIVLLLRDLAKEPVFEFDPHKDRITEARAHLTMGLAMGYRMRAQALLEQLETAQKDNFEKDP